MSNYAHVYYLNPDNRIVLSFNDYMTSLDEVLGEPYGGQGVFIFPAGRMSKPIAWSELDLVSMFNQLESNLFDYAETYEPENRVAFESAFSAMLAESGATESAYKDLVGYSQGDYWRVVAYGPNLDTIKSLLDLTAVYLRNDLYYAQLEQRVTWTSADGRMRDTWEPDDISAFVYSADGSMYPSLAECCEALDVAFDAEPSGDH